MKKVTIHSFINACIIVIGIIPMTIRMDCVIARQKPPELWKVKENLVRKLALENEKIEELFKNLASFQDVLSELRNLELYPSELINLAESTLTKYDKEIGSLEQQTKSINDKVVLQRNSLIDAMEIFREMVLAEPVNSMFTVLENNYSKRAKDLLITDHQIDSLWNTGDSLIKFIMSISAISDSNENLRKPDNIELSTISKSNEKICYKDYCEKIDHIKNEVRKKASPVQAEGLFKIEKYHLLKLIELEKFDLVRQKINSMLNRFNDKRDELNLVLAKVEFESRNFEQVLSTISLISETKENRDQLLILKIQSMYSLKEYELIWQNYRAYDVTKLEGSKRNLLVWILIESGFALKIENDYAQLAALIDNKHTYTHHVLHALARTYLLSGDKKTALSIMESALKYKITSENEKVAVKEIKLSLAQIYYEMGDYDKSLSLFYEILNKHEDFEKALFGIVWCYIKLGNDRKSEIALKKLINLNPESPYASEAIFILARKTLIRANNEWKKTVYLDKEERRLASKLDIIIEKKKSNLRKEDDLKYEYAYNELKSILDRLKKENRMNYDSIKALYNRINSICNMINNLYQTGTFQEVSFSENREKVLFLLDSTLNEVKKNRSDENKSKFFSNAIQNRTKIKSITKKAKIFSVITAIDELKWEREFIEWKKADYRKQEIALDSSMSRITEIATVKILKEKKSDIARIIDSLIISEDRLIGRYTNDLKSRIDALFLLDMDNADDAYMNYQYGELCYTEENMSYSALYERYEIQMNEYYKQLNDFRNGIRIDYPVEPHKPKLDHSCSIKKFKKVIDEFPESDYAAAAYYSLAWCFNDMSKFDSALNCMETLTGKYPTCQYAPQAWLYSGEYHFDKGKLDSAILCYQAVLKYPESEWFEEALYKLAWSQYRLSNPEKAISSFLALVDLGSGVLSGANLLEKESMDYIAISFSEADVTGEKGLDRALIFANKLNDEEKGCRILQRLASVFREQGRYEIAKKTYRNLLKMYPKYANGPVVETELVKLLERDPARNDINKMKRDIFEKYNRQSEWAKNQEETVRMKADSIAQKQLYDAGIGYHQYALQKNDSAAYQNALSSYREFITIYPTSILANECHYNLAEIQFAIGNYYEAAEEYMAVTRRYPDSKYRETAAWNAIVASQNLMKTEK